MKIKKYGAQIEILRREGKTHRQIAEELGLKYSQIKEYFRTDRKEQRQHGYARSKKADALKTNQELRSELKRLRMEVDLLRDFLQLTGRM